MSSHPCRRALVPALVLAALLCAASPAFADPAVQVTPSDALKPAGQTVTVTGSGFSTAPAASPVNAGLYVALVGPNFDSSKMDSPSQGAQFIPQASVIAQNGAFSTTVDAKAQFGSGASAVDCQKVQCVIRVWKAHLDADATQRVTVPVAFAPTVTLDRSADLAAAGDTITVSGVGFKTAPASTPDNAGLYVALVPADYTASSPTQGAAFIPQASVISGNGAFSTPLKVKSSFDQGGVDCLKVACAVRVWRAHTDKDASQRVLLPVGFKPADVPVQTATTSTPPATTPPAVTPPVPTTPVAPPSAPQLSKLTFSTSKIGVSVSTAATVKATVEKRTTKKVRAKGKTKTVVRYVKVKTLTLTAKGAGSVSVNPHLGAGRYRVTVTATGAGGSAKKLTASLIAKSAVK